jgi:hypothetical protein
MNRRYYQAGHSETVKADEDTIDRPFEWAYLARGEFWLSGSCPQYVAFLMPDSAAATVNAFWPTLSPTEVLRMLWWVLAFWESIRRKNVTCISSLGLSCACPFPSAIQVHSLFLLEYWLNLPHKLAHGLQVWQRGQGSFKMDISLQRIVAVLRNLCEASPSASKEFCTPRLLKQIHDMFMSSPQEIIKIMNKYERRWNDMYRVSWEGFSPHLS